MTSLFRILAVSAITLCTSCMSTYRLPAGAPSATLAVPKGVVSWICADSPPQRLVPKNGQVLIPIDTRVTIGANHATSNGYMNYTCSPSSSIIPEAGTEYLQDFEVEAEACTALIYRKTEDQRVGLAFDPTLQRGGAGCTQ